MKQWFVRAMGSRHLALMRPARRFVSSYLASVIGEIHVVY